MKTAPAHVPNELIVDFDLHDNRLADGFNARTRDLPPVSYSLANGGHWIVLGYERQVEILRDPKTFGSYPVSLPPELDVGRGRMVPLEFDPPEHTAYRQLLMPFFSPPRVKKLEPTFRRLASGLIDGFADAGECEFMESFAQPFPALMFLALMGWPEEEADQFTRWVDGFFLHVADDDSEEAKREAASRRASAVESSYSYFADLVQDRRRSPREDITTALVESRLPDGRHLTEDEILDYIFLLLIAGLHTVPAALGFSVIHLAAHPEERRKLIDRPGTIPFAVEEMLRWEPIAWGTARCVVADTTVGGVVLRAGDLVLLPQQSANRDPDVFRDPDTFDSERTPNPHVSFGAGPHRCMGAHLARMELAVALEELHKRVPDYAVDGERPPLLHVDQVRRVERLHLRF